MSPEGNTSNEVSVSYPLQSVPGMTLSLWLVYETCIDCSDGWATKTLGTEDKKSTLKFLRGRFSGFISPGKFSDESKETQDSTSFDRNLTGAFGLRKVIHRKSPKIDLRGLGLRGWSSNRVIVNVISPTNYHFCWKFDAFHFSEFWPKNAHAK